MVSKRKRIWAAALSAALFLCGCGADGPAPEQSQGEEAAAQAVTFVDDAGYEVTVEHWDRVAALYGSYAETWMLAGGELVGTTSDAIEERGLEVGGDVAMVGSVKEPNLEALLAAEPDFVILSADTAGQLAIHQSLTDMGIDHAYYRMDRYQDYLEMLEQFCGMTGRDDLYERYGTCVQEEIEAVLEQVEGRESSSVLLIRAFSTGAKAKGNDNLAGVMLDDLGAENLVEQYDSMLEELSMEEIILADPDYIFVSIMGSSVTKAMDYMRENFESNPAWNQLSAVKEGRYVVLPQELFHYKPNARWGESYRWLAEILYSEMLG